MAFTPAAHHTGDTMNTTPERLSISLGAARLAFLQAEAARLDIGIGELIRRIVDQYRWMLGMCDGTHNG